MHGCEEGGVELCAQYWPATATMMKYGEFMVSTASIDDSGNGFIQRDITIIDPKVRLLSTPKQKMIEKQYKNQKLIIATNLALETVILHCK